MNHHSQLDCSHWARLPEVDNELQKNFWSTMDEINDEERPSRRPCCSRFFLSILAAAAITASICSIYSCAFFSYRALDGQPWEGLTPPFEDLATASVGLFRYSKSSSESGVFGEQCISYYDWTEVGQQQYFIAAQWCSIIAPLLALLALFQIYCEFCCCRLRGSYMLVRFLFFSASVLQLCSFLVFLEKQFCLDPTSQNSCDLENGAYYSLGAVGGFMLVTIGFTFLRPYKDSLVCGPLGCCISTRVGRRNIDADAEAPEKVEGDTSEDDNDEHVVSPSESIHTEDDSEIPEKNGLKVADGMPSPVAGSEDKYARIRPRDPDDPDMMNDADLLSNPSEDVSPDDDEGTNLETEVHADDDAVPEDPPTSTKEEVIVAEPTEHSRHPDFLDMCCGDPLELEKYLTGNTKKKDTTFARNRSESIRSSLRKIALVTEASSHSKKDKFDELL